MISPASVIFTSVSAFVTLWWLGMINLHAGMVMALSSLIGIMAGIWLLNRVKVTHYKQILLVFYVIIFASTAFKLIAG